VVGDLRKFLSVSHWGSTKSEVSQNIGHEENVPSTNIILDELRAFRLLSVEKHIILFTKSVCIKNDSPSTVLISRLFIASITSIRFFGSEGMRFLRYRCIHCLILST
jgi:hypothetical protein